MFNTLRSRLWLSYAILVGVVLGIVLVALVVFLASNPYARQEVELLRQTATLIALRGEGMPALSPERMQTAAERVDRALKVRVIFFSSQGEILADSRAATSPALPSLSNLIGQRQAAIPVFRDARRLAWLYAARPTENGDWVVVAVPRTAQILGVLRRQFVSPLLQAATLALVLSLLLAVGIARWVSAPLQGMITAARAVSAFRSMDGFQRIPLEGPAEVKELAQAFNEMAERVQAGQQSQRDFVANISHDLKTPLTSVQGFAQAILDGTASTPEALHQAASVISSEAGRMHRLVQELLDLARLDAGIVNFEFRSLDLASLLDEMVEKYSLQAQKGQIALRFTPQSLPPVNGDAERLAQVFSNLLDNAMKYTPARGTIDLRARQERNWVQVEVIDNGPGIPPGELERIFERFYQTDKSRQGGHHRGVGLGLAIAREIVQAHGGSISAKNNSGQGSVFVVKLPVAHPENPMITRRSMGIAPPSTQEQLS